MHPDAKREYDAILSLAETVEARAEGLPFVKPSVMRQLRANLDQFRAASLKIGLADPRAAELLRGHRETLEGRAARFFLAADLTERGDREAT